MAELYRNPATNDYSTEGQVEGENVLLRIDPEGRDYLLDQRMAEGDDIPATMLMVMEENNWFSVMEDDASGAADQFRPVGNESETGATPATGHDAHVDDLPVGHLEPRPWMEQENADRFRKETDPATGVSAQPAQTFKSTPADRANANPMEHPEGAAFVRGVWFWVLVVAAVLIVVWVIFEVM